MNLEQPNESLEITPEMRVRGCDTLEELYHVLRDLKEVQGRERVFTAEEIIHHIEQAEFNKVTRALGIRDKVIKLTVGT